MRTRYYKLKLVIVPFNAFCGSLAAIPELPQLARSIVGAFCAAGLALYALVNEVPKSDSDVDHHGGF